ncbi:peptidoglycan-binding domain-containing protein [Vreelandella venusta]|uniref:peptidoglycan-binding domain-containing protein n=1 Tax=Vreelandella venusta TaxID=44935 RepID=UPI003C2AE641
MFRMRKLATVFLLNSCLSGAVFAEAGASLDSEIAALNDQIADAEATLASYDGGLIRTLAETRREALLLLRTMVESRQQVEVGGAQLEITLPAVEPDPERAEQLLGEMASQQLRVEAAEDEAASSGGLIQALALSRVETEKLTLAQLQMGYLQARYGIAFPVMNQPSQASTTTVPNENADSMDANAGESLPWADPDYPNIDYSLAPFEQAYSEGHRIEGWWTVEEELAAVDDSLRIIAVNYSAYESGNFSGLTALIAQCREGDTSLVFVQDEFLRGNFRRNTLDITYRIDTSPAQSTRWGELTSNKGAGLFGGEAESMLRDLYDAEKFFIRITDSNGQRHDAEFDLAGAQNTIDAVAGACGWTTLNLTQDDYRAIQMMLNAGGFEAGTPDGIWGTGSRSAMRDFQEQQGLPATGAPDRETLQALGVE